MTQRLLPFVLGLVAATGQAPVDAPLLMVFACSGAMYLFSQSVSPRAAIRLGFGFGFGYFAVALHWIVSPFLVDAPRHGWMAPFAVVMMAAGGAVFWAAAFWCARRISQSVWVLALCMTGTELVRAYIFTGFPWASPAQAIVGTLPGQVLAWVGPHGATLIVLCAAALLAQPRLPRMARIGAALPLTAALLVPVSMAPAPLSDTVLRLVQPNAPQHEKWDPEKIRIFYDRQLLFTSAPADQVLGPADAVIWPETAIPWNLQYADTVLAQISAAAQGVPVVLGVQRTQEGRHFNSLVALGPQGQVDQLYDKHHLVPFGEYVPLGNFAAQFGFYGLAPQHGAGFSSGAGPQLMDLGPLGRALPLICYEAVFAHDVGGAPQRPDFIIHATNDAWFGTYAGPQQHLAQARMRAIEQGLPVARAANTGITAMIDPWGRVLREIDLGQSGYIDAALPLARAPTLYSRTGDGPIAAIILLLLVFGMLRARRHRRTVRE